MNMDQEKEINKMKKRIWKTQADKGVYSGVKDYHKLSL